MCCAKSPSLRQALTRLMPSPPAQPPAWTGAAHRAFDFWLGDWQVHKPGQATDAKGEWTTAFDRTYTKS